MSRGSPVSGSISHWKKKREKVCVEKGKSILVYIGVNMCVYVYVCVRDSPNCGLAVAKKLVVYHFGYIVRCIILQHWHFSFRK